MKKVLKTIGGFIAVMTLVCLLTAPAQARVFVNVGFGFPLFYGPSYCPSYGYYCAPPACYYRPTYRYYCAPPAYYYSGGGYYRCR